jgi:hypothetical protein
MGYAVEEQATFENRLEDRLNTEAAGQQKYELLNFAQLGYGGFQKLMTLESKAFAFDPDAVFFVTYSSELDFSLWHIARVVRTGSEIPAPYRDVLVEVITTSGVTPETPDLEMKRWLGPRMPDLMTWIFQRFAKECSRQGAIPYVVYRPSAIALEGKGAQHEREVRLQLTESAAQAGLTVLDLSDSFQEVQNWQALLVAPWDDHINALGHSLLAETLYRRLHDQQTVPFFQGADRRP